MDASGNLTQTFDPALLDTYRAKWPHIRWWYLTPRVRRINNTLHFLVGVSLSGAGLATADWKEGLGRGNMWLEALTNNAQIPARVTGSAGTIHWFPGLYIRFWTPGNQVFNVSTWAYGDWPSSLPGTAAQSINNLSKPIKTYDSTNPR
ncbi:MAG: hypothetical protein ACK5LN_04395 [Propioniciclava sp.]